MTNTTKKRALAVLTLAAVAAVSYAAGAAKGRQPVNMPFSEMNWSPLGPDAPLQIAKLWGDRDKGEYAMLLKIPPGFESGVHAHTADYYGITIQGTWVHTNDGDTSPPKELPVGSYVFQPGKQYHNDQCKGTQECIVFVHQHAKGDFLPPKGAAGAKEKK